MGKKVKILIMTPERVLFRGEAESVIAPGYAGEFGVFPEHQNFLTPLDIGELRVVNADETDCFAMHGGFLEVYENTVTVLADAAEHGHEIDITRADLAKKRAEQRIDEKHEDVDLLRVELSLRRALTRLKVNSSCGERKKMKNEH